MFTFFIRVYPSELLSFYFFHEDTGKPLASHKRTNSLYLTRMASDPKNIEILSSSILKVGEIKAHLF